MEIERINENTVKFYISYVDIEDRGFEREEIWYNRERSEQLFWQMMEEVNYEEDFNVEGPLWIQVQALEKGLEIIVTKAQLSKNGETLELPLDDAKMDGSVNEKVESLLEEKFGKSQNQTSSLHENDDYFWMISIFDEFEDIIQWSHNFSDVKENMQQELYVYQNQYYLYLKFPQEADEDRQEDLISRVLEYSEDTDMTYHVLHEYGKLIMAGDVCEQVRNYFPM
ncbi:adaptor protein MecA [Virgibacillus sp. 179-BFC.A HS]|uniref:Adapter protein MecA n=1 Tax=Tigheibacillus jepli TaxID=3035914 RepID=A0ABU5CIK2_9BACI|nr:adaptor protein MecA [Virgibacillus sp. 179-BFC.A HS]MDY0406174.1 adaptor protein MecA [Virgibacillus sp. 179-BFC.A HS]